MIGPTAGRTLLAGTLVACLSALQPVAWAAPLDVGALLARALSGPAVPFRGVQRTVVYQDNGAIVSEVVVHADGRRCLRREYRTGPAAGVVMLHTPVATYQRTPGGPWQRLPSPIEGKAAELARMVRTNYTVSVAPGAKVCGRSTVTITVAAKRPYNPSRKLTVDRATGVPLIDELSAPDGRLRSRSTYTEWKPGAQPAALFVTPHGKLEEGAGFGPASFEARRGAPDVERETGRPVPKPTHIPEGYGPTAYGVMTTGSGMRTPAVRYGDGIASFTVLQRGAAAAPRPRGWGWGRMGAGPRGPGRGRMGQGGPRWSEPALTEDRQGATVTYSSRQASYVLVGDLAGSELLAIARSLP